MKITVSKKELYEKLKMAGKVVGTSKTMPIIENFMFSIENGKMVIIGSDVSGMIEARVELVNVEGNDNIKFVVDKTLFTALSELSDQPIEMIIDQNKHIEVNYHNGQFEIQGRDADAFPILTMPEDSQTIEIDRQQMIEGLRTVIPFVANNEIRPVMNGVYVESKDSRLTFVATDANTLASREYVSDNTPEFGAIIPTKAVKMIQSVISEYLVEKLAIIISNKSISIATDHYTITYRLIEGRYPNYRAVIPVSCDTKVTLEKSEFLSLIKRVSVFSNVNSRLLKLDINHTDVNVSAQDIDYSISAKENMFAEVDGNQMTVGFHATKLAEIINSVDTDQCELKLIDKTKAGIINPVGISGVTLLIMPMTIND